MNNKPVLLRSLFALLVLGVFIFSMFPLGQKDFNKTLSGMMENANDPGYAEILKKAQEIKAYETAQGRSIYDSAAIEEALSIFMVTDVKFASAKPNFKVK